MIKAWLLLFMAISYPCMICGQHFTGIPGSNYAGIQSISANPSSLSNSKKSFDVLLLGGNLAFHNNYIFIPKTDNRFSDKMNLARNALQLEFPGFYDDDYIFDDRDVQSPKFGYLNLRVSGPGFMRSWGNRTVAFTFSNRMVVSGSKVPFDVVKFAYERRHYPPLYELVHSHNGSFTIGSASWSEIGVTYSAMIDLGIEHSYAAGISIRRLFGLHAIVMHSNDLSYSFINSDSMQVHRFKGSLGIALPVDYDNNSFLDLSNAVQGKGFAIDAGITIIRSASNDRYKLVAPGSAFTHYDYRLGISLLDIGMIHYNGNSGMMNFNDVHGLWQGLDSLEINSVNAFKNEIRSTFAETGGLSETNAFDLILPTALSVQFDYNLGLNFFMNVAWTQNLKLGAVQLSQPSVVNITPRFETRFFEMAIPFSLFQYNELHMGLVLRAGFLTIGTTRLGGFFGFNDFEGVDFFFSVSAGLCKLRYQRNYDRYGNCYPFF